MSKINVYKVILTKKLDFEMEADSPENALKMAREMVNDDGMFWIEQEEEEPVVEEITTGHFCPVCGSSLRYAFMNAEGKILNTVYSCMNDDCALDWTIATDTENGNFLGIQRYFFG